MKKIVLLFVFVLCLYSIGNAQEQQSKKKGASERLTLEQRNILQLKNMTLDLDLTTSQQKQIEPIIAEQTSKREAKKAEMKSRKETKKVLTANEKFELKNKNLNEQIELKAKMRKILTDEQMKKWEMKREKMKSNQKQKNKTKTEVSE